MSERYGQQMGNYRLIKRLGRGGAADVYLGEHVFLHTKAAIKIVPVSMTASDLPAFLNEARMIANLAHPNIIRVLDFGVQDETPFLVMEYAPNGTLRQRHPLGQRLHPTSIVPLVTQVADALQYAHDLHIIHRDVKPENMLLGGRDEVLLSDFGIALVSQSLSVQQMQDVVGTVAYMAPEQFQGKAHRSSDQYALAVVIYEWLSGERLFQGNLAAVSHQHFSAPPPHLSGKMPGISPEIDEVLQVALAKEPGQRFASIKAFRNALIQACHASAALSPDAIDQHAPTVLVAPPPPGQARVSISDIRVSMPTTDVQRELYTPVLRHVETEPVRRQSGVSRRALLLGVSGGAFLVGGLATLALAGKLATLFAHSPATPSGGAQTPGAQKSPARAIGTTLFTYTGHGSDVTSVGWSPAGGQIVASGSFDKTVAVWNASTGNTRLTHLQGDQVYNLAWSPSGQYLASSGNPLTVQVWDAATDNLLATYTGHTSSVYSLAWSPNGQYIVSASGDKTAQVWSAATGSLLLTLAGHTDKVWAVSWSMDGRSIASVSFDGTVKVWDANSGNQLHSYATGAPLRAVAWSHDSNALAFGGDSGSVQIWQPATGTVISTYRGHTNHIEDIQWYRNGQQIASASKDTTVQIWRTSDAQHLYTYRGHSQLVWALSLSPDGQLIASASGDRTVQIWQAV